MVDGMRFLTISIRIWYYSYPCRVSMVFCGVCVLVGILCRDISYMVVKSSNYVNVGSSVNSTRTNRKNDYKSKCHCQRS